MTLPVGCSSESVSTSGLSRIANFYVDYVLSAALIGLVYAIVCFINTMKENDQNAFVRKFPREPDDDATGSPQHFLPTQQGDQSATPLSTPLRRTRGSRLRPQHQATEANIDALLRVAIATDEANTRERAREWEDFVRRTPQKRSQGEES
ncbi:hypothetical protein K0U07_03490 [bacterium]|nr:hypothetical protein [bacterium]